MQRPGEYRPAACFACFVANSFFLQQGVILKDDDHYFVEPLWNNTNGDRNYFSTTSSPLNEITDDKESHPHVIVKQSKSQRFANEQKNRKDSESCGYSGLD